MEWLWLTLCAIVIAFTGDVPAFSIFMLLVMTLSFKIVENAFERTGVRQFYVWVWITEIFTLGFTAVVTGFIKEVAIGFEGLFQFFFNHYTGEFKKAIKAQAIENGQAAIDNATSYAELISDALYQTFMSPPFLTGESVIGFAILGYTVTRLSALGVYGHQHKDN